MTIYASPFMVFLAVFWSAQARRTQATDKWDKRFWVGVEVAQMIAMLLALTGHAHWSHA